MGQPCERLRLLHARRVPAVQPQVEGAVEPQPDRRWYTSGWVIIASGYVFPPLGLYLMWRYKDWPALLKASVTVIGLTLAGLSTYLSSTYVMPNVF